MSDNDHQEEMSSQEAEATTEKQASILTSVMSNVLAGVDPSSLPYLRVGTEWTYIEVLSEPFVIYKRDRYTPVIVVEELESERKSLLFVAAVSLARCLEPIREKRGTLVGLNIRVRKKGEDRFSEYDIEELAD